jgi:hypothetical protein
MFMLNVFLICDRIWVKLIPIHAVVTYHMHVTVLSSGKYTTYENRLLITLGENGSNGGKGSADDA